MLNLYHYCAAWMENDQINQSGGLIRTPDAICFDSYNDFVAAVRRQVGKEDITITSLSYLGRESE